MKTKSHISGKQAWGIQLSLVLLFACLGYLGLGLTEQTDQLLWQMDFGVFMFYMGILLGLLYNLFELLALFYQVKRKGASPSLSYLLRILPTTYVFSVYVWYLFVMWNRIISDNQEDFIFFQTIIVAFSVFSILVRMGRELKTLYQEKKKME